MKQALEAPAISLARPQRLEDAIVMLRDGSRLLAGGCDLLPALCQGQLAAQLVSLADVPGLETVVAHPRLGLRVGANVPAARLLTEIWAGKRFAAVHESIEFMEPPYVANMGTLVGNVVAARPESDLGLALLAMEGVLEIVGVNGPRRIPLTDFYDNKGRLERGDIAVAVTCPGPGTDGGSAFKKLALVRRFAADPGKLGAAATIIYGPERERIRSATLALGGICLPRRFPAIEAQLVGELPDPVRFLHLAKEAISKVEADMRPATRRMAITLMVIGVPSLHWRSSRRVNV